jgi:type IV pilus assembly protein PilZ
MTYDPFGGNSNLGPPSAMANTGMGLNTPFGPISGFGAGSSNPKTVAPKAAGLAAKDAAPGGEAAATGARPGVLSLNIRERTALYAAYMPFLKGGGIFIPTNRPYRLGDEVFMLLSLMDDPAKIAVQGKVVWITPEGVQGNRTQGIGVQFTADETGAAARNKIETILGGTLSASRPTHTI